MPVLHFHWRIGPTNRIRGQTEFYDEKSRPPKLSKAGRDSQIGAWSSPPKQTLKIANYWKNGSRDRRPSSKVRTYYLNHPHWGGYILIQLKSNFGKARLNGLHRIRFTSLTSTAGT